jgi:hypothetical protein
MIDGTPYRRPETKGQQKWYIYPVLGFIRRQTAISLPAWMSQMYYA